MMSTSYTIPPPLSIYLGPSHPANQPEQNSTHVSRLIAKPSKSFSKILPRQSALFRTCPTKWSNRRPVERNLIVSPFKQSEGDFVM